MMVIGEVPDFVGSEVLESASFQCTVCEGEILGSRERRHPVPVVCLPQALIGGCHPTSRSNQILFYAVRCLK